MQAWHTRTAHCLHEEAGLAKHAHIGSCLSGVCHPATGGQENNQENSFSQTMCYQRLKLVMLCCRNSVVRRYLRYISRQALFAYRLIDSTLIEIFSHDPLLF